MRPMEYVGTDIDNNVGESVDIDVEEVEIVSSWILSVVGRIELKSRR
jgi:hypothetical protein